ncbi:MAG: hypothetical protein WA803_08820 [Steroidobacteraceae bacterium]
MDLLRLGIVWDLILEQSVGEILEFLEIDRFVEFPLRGGRDVVAPNGESARAVVG